VDSARHWSRKMKSLQTGVDILITNLNKMQRMINSRQVLLNNIEFIVNDESDVFVENMKREYEEFMEVFAKM
jgi:hypothetical protein